MRETSPPASVAETLRHAAATLAAVSDTARLDAEVLMAHALGATRSDMLLRHMRDAAPDIFAALAARRMRHEPVAYITGHQEFYGRDFRVTPDVLIPRGDSETVVETAFNAVSAPRRVLDCGTGSGALLLSVLAERAGAEGIGVDRSPAALAVAADNAARLGLGERAQMLLRDWDRPGWRDGLGQFDLILANPPYVEDDAPLAQSVRGYEPAGALFAGPEGLDAYRVLLAQFPELMTRDGVAVVEIGATQADAVEVIAADAGFVSTLHRDLGGRPRAVLIRFGVGKAS